ncbi:IclR family transcriptional regulator domain-containing protein, partial [Enterobacter hormaechei]|uniref:IclR family transcriptional regulator domain-containing protein n=1 Tax=Enterobacter hormaechei TaxID=158836 RepID=UPI0023B8727A
AIPYLDKIRNETHETAVLAIGDGQDVVIIEKSDSSQAVQTFSPLGSRTPMHCSSLGKAFLMVDTEDKLARLKQPLRAFT